MSRAAVAHDLTRLVARPGRSSTTGYRLLGENIAAPVQAGHAAGATWRPQGAPASRGRQVASRVQHEVEAYYPASAARARKTVKVAHPQWLFGTFVCMVALLAVGPVMASGRAGSGARRIAMSGFPGAATPAAAAAQPRQETVIDVQSATQAAPLATAPVAAAKGGRKYDLLGAPSVSVGTIEAVLKEYGSDAVGRGQAIYDLGVRYGIDPAYALAFFVHESGCGTKGVARFTHSIGNIRWTAGYDNYEGYRSYATWEQGIEDWYKLMTDLYINGWGLRTVDAIIPRYAPYGDNNNPPVYAASVKAMVDSWRGK